VCVSICLKHYAKFNLLLEFHLILCVLKVAFVCVCVCVCVCVYVEASSKWFFNCCYKVNVILKVTKNQGICFKDLCYKLLRLFTHKYVNILRTVLIIESV
jgi:hypothetical protein